MVKEAISRTTHTTDAINEILAQYNFPSCSSHKSLAGGFSGTNYRINFHQGSSVCLKICHGYEPAFVEAQARVQDHLQQHGYQTACFAAPLHHPDGQTYRFTAIDATTGDPVLILSFVEGRAADALLEEHKVSTRIVFYGMGMSLGVLHSVPVHESDNLRTYKQGGACDVWKQMESTMLKQMLSCSHTKTHPFVTDFYPSRRNHLENIMRQADSGLTRGVIHGDPFADNVMLDPATGNVNAWVDWEDATTGPILFDVGVSIVGCCFPENSAVLDLTRLKTLMAGYTQARPLPKEEYDLLIDFCRLSLLCNCSWRFTNFNIEHRDIEQCRNRYVELQERIVELEKASTQHSILGLFSQNEEGHYVVKGEVEVQRDTLDTSDTLDTLDTLDALDALDTLDALANALNKSSARVCAHMNADHSGSVLAYAHRWYDPEATAAVMTHLNKRGFVLSVTVPKKGTVEDVLIPYTSPLTKASQVRKIAVQMHVEAFNGLGFRYKWKTGYYMHSISTAMHHVPKQYLIGGSVAVVVVAGVGWFLKQKYGGTGGNSGGGGGGRRRER